MRLLREMFDKEIYLFSAFGGSNDVEIVYDDHYALRSHGNRVDDARSTPVSMSWPPAETNPATSRADFAACPVECRSNVRPQSHWIVVRSFEEIQATISGRAGDASHCVTTVVLP